MVAKRPEMVLPEPRPNPIFDSTAPPRAAPKTSAKRATVVRFEPGATATIDRIVSEGHRQGRSVSMSAVVCAALQRITEAEDEELIRAIPARVRR